MIVWITGLSAVGKTTLCNAIYSLVKRTLPELVVLDGEMLRGVMGHDLGHAEPDRIIAVKRLQRLAQLLTDQGQIVLVGVLYANPELLAWNRENLSGYFEVYLRASVDTVAARDRRGLYEKAFAGKMRDVVGIDIPWHEPRNPNLVIDVDDPPSPEEIARRVIAAVPPLEQALLQTRAIPPSSEQ